ncbi:hypothetical protein MHOCP_04900 [Moorella humiferrea]|uniref:hypothetical protein n=1 Tax=Neomoorella humiferrea TaxID=676965 RepID=UPI0030D26109
MSCRERLINLEVLEALLDDYLSRKSVSASYKRFLLRMIEGQVEILVHNLLQKVDDTIMHNYKNWRQKA